MSSTTVKSRMPLLFGIGLAAGMAIATVENFAFEGEVSPIVIVGLLFTMTSIAGWIWGWGGGFASVAAWVCVPLAHVVKHLLGLPDTLQPNTYTSMLMLAVFTFAIAAIGTGCGVLLRKFTTIQILAAFVAMVLTCCSGEPVGPDSPLIILTGMLEVAGDIRIPEFSGPEYTLWNEDFTTALPLLGPIRNDDDQLLISAKGYWVEPTAQERKGNPGITGVLRVTSYDVKSRIRYHDFLVPAAKEHAQQLYGCSVEWNKTFGWDVGSSVPIIWVRMTNTFSVLTPRPYFEFSFDAKNGNFLGASDNLDGRSPCDS
jgi:hypothetical protein